MIQVIQICIWTAGGRKGADPHKQRVQETKGKLAAYFKSTEGGKLGLGEQIMAIATATTRPPLPPFTGESAIQEVRLAEDSWNTRDPQM